MAKVSCKDFDPEKLSICEDTENKYTYRILYNGHELKISTPRLQCLNVIKGNAYTAVDLICSGVVSDVLESVDSFVIAYVTENSESVLGKKRSHDKVEDIFKDTLRYHKGKSFIRARIADSGAKVYDKQGKDLQFEELNGHINQNDILQALLRLDCVRAAPGTVKCNWYIDQLKLHKIVSDCLISDDENESPPENKRRKNKHNERTRAEEDSESEGDESDNAASLRTSERISRLTNDYDY